MTPSWYDVLDVSADADAAEIEAAWKATIADLGPSDRRFRLANQAAEVLLDPDRRAAHDAELASRQEPVDEQPVDGQPVDERPAVQERAPEEPTAAAGAAPRGGIPTWLLAAVGVLMVLLVALTAWTAMSTTSDAAVDEATRAAQTAAEEAVEPVLSYDATRLAEDRAVAADYLTPDFREEYDKLFDGIVEQNAPELGTRVVAEVLASGVIRADTNRARIFLFVDQSVTNKEQAEPIVYRNHVTVVLEKTGGEWLVDELITAPSGG
ncbi:hypothetical protein [Nocardioides sp.]|uniref:hypothetical protein n=1 Tax=Nocardioides sp. TaxID=35761 RepID=UPI0027323925|nr:hypothetical protein [Nocardioides sp.]MDP3894019.1 hypothetical protein [Nocardioides sp.]